LSLEKKFGLLDCEMASQTQGIQQLLSAEKKAAEKINEARKRKAKRLKQAKEEAQAEVDKYRSERENQFREYERKHLGTKEDIAARIEKETVAQLEQMQRNIQMNKDKVIKDLLATVCEIIPEVHQNLRREQA